MEKHVPCRQMCLDPSLPFPDRWTLWGQARMKFANKVVGFNVSVNLPLPMGRSNVEFRYFHLNSFLFHFISFHMIRFEFHLLVRAR